jgi:hypothetical protein
MSFGNAAGYFQFGNLAHLAITKQVNPSPEQYFLKS